METIQFKAPFNERPVFARQKGPEPHTKVISNGTTRVANRFLWVQIVDSAHNKGKLEEPLNNSKSKSCTKKSVPDVPEFQKREKNIGSFAV